MKIFIFLIFFNIFKGNIGQIYKTLFIKKLIGIFVISDSSINFYHYTTFKKNSVLKYDFAIDEQKISSTSEGDMISIGYICDDTYCQTYIIVKKYLYVFSSEFVNYIKLDYLEDKYSVLVFNECNKDETATIYCSLFISFINSENKLEIYKYKFKYNTINYSKQQSIIDLNSSGQISLNNHEYISCNKATNVNNLDVLVCFYENDNSEIAAITLNKDTLKLEKEVKFKKNSGAKKIKSVSFNNNEKVFVCYINNNDNLACVIFDEPQNIFQNEFKYIEKVTQSQKYFNIEYFSSTNQFILSAYSSDTEFEYIIFDENMNLLDNDSINKIEIDPCNDESTPLSITIYYFNNYKIAKKCGNEDFSSNVISDVSTSKPFALETIFVTDNLIKLPHSSLVTNKSLTETISSINNYNGYLSDKISSTTIYSKISSTNIINTSVPSEEKTSKGSNSESIISYNNISTNFQSIIQSSLIKYDKISTNIKTNIASETISTNFKTNDILSNKISINTN